MFTQVTTTTPAPVFSIRAVSSATDLSPQELVLAYLDHGIAVVPEIYGTTRPQHSGWLTANIDRSNLEEFFPLGQAWNIGFRTGEAGNQVIDVDLDVDEAVRLAPHFLPATGWVYGRDSNPASHWIYRVDEEVVPTLKFEGADGKVLVELRGDGSKSTAPPSFKISINEFVRWDRIDLGSGPPTVPLTVLRRSVSLLAVATIVRRVYPPNGARHYFILAFAGGLFYAGLNLDEVKHLILTVAEDAGDLKLSDRSQEIISTFESFSSHLPITGMPTLKKLIGGSTVNALRKALQAGVPEPEGRSIPLEALPEPIKSIVEGISGALDADPSLSLLPLLAALSSAIGTTRVVRAGGEWSAYPFLWVCSIAEAGGCKTPARKPIAEILARREVALLESFRIAHDAFEEDEERYKKSRGQVESDRPEKPTRPLAPCGFTTDVTFESLSAKLVGNRKGLILWSEELTDILSTPGRYSSGGGEICRFNSLYDGSPIRVSRKTGEIQERDFTITRAGVAIACGVQPNVLVHNFKPEYLDSGFFQRFLFVKVESRLQNWRGLPVPEAAKASLQSLFNALYEFKHIDDEHNPLVYNLDQPARELFISWNGFLEVLKFSEADPHKKSALSKQRELPLRLACIFHSVNSVRFSLPADTLINVRTMIQAILLSQWFISQWSEMYGYLRSDGRVDLIERLLALIHSKSDGNAKPRDLMRWNNRLYPTSETATSALQGLVDLGLARLPDSSSARVGLQGIQLIKDVKPFEDTPARIHRVYEFQPPSGLGLDPTCMPGFGAVQRDLFDGLVTGTGNGTAQEIVDQTTPPTSAVPNEAPRYVFINSEADMHAALLVLGVSTELAIDLETTGLEPARHRIRLITITASSPSGVYSTFIFDLFSEIDSGQILTIIQEKRLYLHNAAFDLGFLRTLGCLPDGKIHDTLVMARLLHAGTAAPSTLQACVKRYLDIDLPKDEQRGDWSKALTESQLAYAANDTVHLFSLANRLLLEMEAVKLSEVYDLEIGCLQLMVEMGYNGVPVDTTEWQRLYEENLVSSTRLKSDLSTLSMNDTIPWNWNSTKQIKQAFHNLGIALQKTSDDYLAKVDHPLASTLRQYRKIHKLISTYGPSWLERVINGRVFPNWKQLEATTGRMSCSEPNIQQLPKNRYRSAIAPGEGKVLVRADYSQIELRVLAEVTRDSIMLGAYREGYDLHELTARQVLQVETVSREHRQLAKALNFGLAFGMGAEAFANYARSGYGVELTEVEAKRHRAKFLSTYLGVKRWQERTTSATGKLQPETRTLSGRRRLFEPGHGHTERLNTPIQGTAVDGLKAALGLLWQRRNSVPEVRIIIVCHDEVVVEVPIAFAEQAKDWLIGAMVEGMTRYVHSIPVLVEASISTSWHQH